jgi:hypothetical protein
MLWRVISASAAEAGVDCQEIAPDGRFVIHRHRDETGPHLDLRIEQDGCLLGWRIDAIRFDGEPWATEKLPHPLTWLDQDGDALREDAGVFAWLERGAESRRLVLCGRTGNRVMHFERAESLPPRLIGAIREAVTECGAHPSEVPRLIADGWAARRRAVARFCGLGRELDGDAFDEAVWRKALAALSLEEIHAQLRAYEVRLDRKYPPAPVSKPEPLPDGPQEGRAEAALAILDE